eukprot:scaffold24862_cov117-Cylindrotheca_fusiformis.AAC.3
MPLLVSRFCPKSDRKLVANHDSPAYQKPSFWTTCCRSESEKKKYTVHLRILSGNEKDLSYFLWLPEEAGLNRC